MIATSLRTNTLKWVLVALLAAMLVGAIAMAYWLPIIGYSVTCDKSELISCEIRRDRFADSQSWQVALGTQAVATVNIQPRRLGSARTLLYLSSSSQTFFAAEFEGGEAVAQAEESAAKLNRVFSSTVPASASIAAHPPAYFTWLIWIGIGLLGMFVLVIYRQLFNEKC